MFVMVVDTLFQLTQVKTDIDYPLRISLKWIYTLVCIVLMTVHLKWDKRALYVLLQLLIMRKIFVVVDYSETKQKLSS